MHFIPRTLRCITETILEVTDNISIVYILKKKKYFNHFKVKTNFTVIYSMSLWSMNGKCGEVSLWGIEPGPSAWKSSHLTTRPTATLRKNVKN